MRRLLMAEQWSGFATKVLPRDANAVQKQEMRRAFYAGGEAIFHKIISSLAPEGEPTEQDLRLMQDLENELLEFGKAVGREEA